MFALIFTAWGHAVSPAKRRAPCERRCSGTGAVPGAIQSSGGKNYIQGYGAQSQPALPDSGGDAPGIFQNLRKRDLRVLGLRRRRIIGCAVSAILFTAGFLTTFTALKRLETTESWLKLAEYSAGALQEGNMEQAIQYSLEAFPPQNSPLVPQYVPEAQRSLTNALGVYDLSDSFKSHGTVQLPSAPLYVSLSPHGTTAACVYSGAVAVVDTAACRITQSFSAAPSL